MSPRWRGTVSGKVTDVQDVSGKVTNQTTRAQVFVMGCEKKNGALASDRPKRGCVMSEEFDEGRFRAQVGVFRHFFFLALALARLSRPCTCKCLCTTSLVFCTPMAARARGLCAFFLWLAEVLGSGGTWQRAQRARGRRAHGGGSVQRSSAPWAALFSPCWGRLTRASPALAPFLTTRYACSGRPRARSTDRSHAETADVSRRCAGAFRGGRGGACRC